MNRRTVLRGLGTAIALPFLDAMLTSPLIAAKAGTPAAPPKRMAFMYIPNGVIGKNWFPKQTGTEFELPSSLEPLDSLRNDITLVSGLSRVYLAGEPHSQAGSCWLTSAKPNERADGVTAIDRTLDQVVAQRIGNHTAFSSIELSCNQFQDKVEPKIFDSISWYGPGNDAKSMNDPRKVFQRLFGKSKSVKASVLDTVLEDARSFEKRLGVEDRRKLDEYVTSVRSVERRLTRQELSKNGIQTIDFEVPEKLPTNRGEYVRLMGDLMLLAFRTDQTRIASMMVGPERWETPQRYDDVFANPVNHHVMTHDHAYDEQVAKIDRFHVQQYAYLVQKMKSIREGESTLLDQCCFVLGSGIGDGAIHSYENLPVVIAGRGGGAIKNGHHLRFGKGTPLANLWLTLGNAMGAELQSFADSGAELDLLNSRVASTETD